jgi:hypothetical protein
MTLDYLLTADYASVARDGKVSVCGIFHNVTCVSLPAQQACWIVAQVTGMRTEVGPHHLSIRFKDPDDVEVIQLEAPFEIPEPAAAFHEAGYMQLIHAALPLGRVGPHVVELRVDGALMGTRLMRVFELPKPPEEAKP